MKICEISVLHLDAGNCRNGNPRRLYVLMHPQQGMLCAVEEAYRGWAALQDVCAYVTWEGFGSASGYSAQEHFVAELRKQIQGTIPVPPKFYHQLLNADTQRGFRDRRSVITLE